MMRIVSFVLVCLLLAGVSAQEGGATNQPQRGLKTPMTVQEYGAMIFAEIEGIKKEWGEAPATLAEAHTRLEQMLSAEELAIVDAMPSERGMSKYHMGLGAGIRNGWGLWRGSALAQHMRELGFIHPDTMSGVILNTFWCKRHGQDLHLEALAASAKLSREARKRARQEEKNRVQKAKAAIRNMMMGLRFETREVPMVPIAIRRDGLSVRSFCPFRDGDPADGERRTGPKYHGVARRRFCFDEMDGKIRKMKPGEAFCTDGWYFDPVDRKVHKIRVAELDQVSAAVVAGERAWFAGQTNGGGVLVGISDQDRITMPLPEEDEILDLGLDGQSLLAVYAKRIYRLADRKWTVVHSGDVLLPRSGLPPQRHGNMVFLRDEGINEIRKRLWWLTMGEQPDLSALDRDVGLVGRSGPAWYDSSSYCVTSTGDLWACIGKGLASSLIRRSKEGRYSIAIMNGFVQFTGDLLDTKRRDQDLLVSAVTVLPDDTLLLGGNTGLYRLKGNELVQELAFAFEETSDNARIVLPRREWNPTNVLMLNDGSYCVDGGYRRGVYWIRQDDDGQWTCQCAGRGDPVVW
jgi:Domain of unknown function (DUF6794)